MSERPIIFNGAMVRAILEGRKTQTRRIVAPDNVYDDIARDAAEDYELRGWTTFWRGKALCIARLSYARGDLLWVRETWAPVRDYGEEPWVDYRATPRWPGESDKRAAAWDNEPGSPDAIRWRPSIHMPRWASRITLRVTDVRVQRLQDISESDAKAEGWPGAANANLRDAYPIGWFAWLWASIHGHDAWEANPWVAAIGFERIAP